MGLIVVSIDTLRADYLSCYGHARVLTPSFDRLAAGGVMFRSAISAASTTSPSHASLLTGLYVQDHNVYSNFDALGDQPLTLGEVFSSHGFSTFYLSNMKHMNPEVSHMAQGFQTVVRSGHNRRAAQSFDRFLSWLDETEKKPFFAFLHLQDVHTPYRPPPPYDRFYYDADERDPANKSLEKIAPLLPKHMSDHPHFKTWLSGITDIAWVFAQYQGAVTYVDDEFGRLLDELEARSLLHRTAIVFTADHGESLGEHGMHFVHTGLYEPTIHVPLIMWFPGSGRHGAEVRDVVESVDVFPTLLEYFDVQPPPGIRGRSLWPLIKGELVEPRTAFVEHAGKNLVALRGDRYKYIKHLRNNHIQPAYPFTEGREELYDLREDPGELHDLSARRPEIIEAMRREVEVRRRGRLNMATGEAEVSTETTEVLRSLGYIE